MSDESIYQNHIDGIKRQAVIDTLHLVRHDKEVRDTMRRLLDEWDAAEEAAEGVQHE